MDGLYPHVESVGEFEGGRERGGTGSHAVDAKNDEPVSGRGNTSPSCNNNRTGRMCRDRNCCRTDQQGRGR